MMIVLHNSMDKDSRDFVDSLGINDPNSNRVKIYDWYRGGQEQYYAEGGTEQPSAFPSVVHTVPAHVIPARPEIGENYPEIVPGGEHVQRKPLNIDAVGDEIDRHNNNIEQYNAGVPPNRRVPLVERPNIVPIRGGRP